MDGKKKWEKGKKYGGDWKGHKDKKRTAYYQGGKVFVEGDTFPIKDDLKALGFKWDSERRTWWKLGKLDDLREDLEALGVEVQQNNKANSGRKV